MRKKLKSAKGSVSIFVIIVMIFLLPFAIWVGIELPKMHELNQRVKDAVDSAAASAVTSANGVDQDSGLVTIDHTKAEDSARQVFALKMGLSFDASGGLYAKDESHIEYVERDMPYIDVFDSKNPNPQYKNSTVIVTATVTFKNSSIFGRDITVTQTGMSEARFNPN